MSLLPSKSDLIKILLFVGVFYIPPGLLFSHILKTRAETAEAELRSQNANSVVELVQSLNESGKNQEVCSQLEAETRAARIILFAYKDKSYSCSSPSDMPPEKYPAKIEGAIHTYKTDNIDISYQKVNIGDGVLVVGYENPAPKSLFHYLTNSIELFISLLIELGLVIWVVAGFLVFIISRNLNKIKKIFVSHEYTPKTLKIIDRLFGWLTVDDVQVVEQATLETTNKLLSLQQGIYFEETSLQYSLLAEIRSEAKLGRNIEFPYKFYGVTVRVDINGYSNIMRNTSLEVTRSINTSFKSIAAELAYRYHGLFENSAGDEVVYCFKGEQAVLRGVAFVRDLMADFAAIEFKDGNNKSFNLFVKASLDASEMLMDIGAARVEFDGLSLLYTNRMFGGLPLKDKNVLIVSPKLEPEVQPLCHILTPVNKVVSKGMELEVLYVTEFKSKDICVDVGLNVSQLFKSDHEIVALLNRVDSEEMSINDRLNELLGLTRIKNISTDVTDSWIAAIDRVALNKTLREKHPQLLPTLISLGPDLIGVKNWSQSCSEAVRRAILTAQERVTGNAIEAFVKLDKADEANRMVNLSMVSGRLKANALIAKTLAFPTEEHLHSIKQMMISKNKAEMASGLYAAASVIVLSRKRNDNSLIVLKEYQAIQEILKKSAAKNDLSQRVQDKIKEAIGA